MVRLRRTPWRILAEPRDISRQQPTSATALPGGCRVVATRYRVRGDHRLTPAWAAPTSGLLTAPATSYQLRRIGKRQNDKKISAGGQSGAEPHFLADRKVNGDTVIRVLRGTEPEAVRIANRLFNRQLDHPVTVYDAFEAVGDVDVARGIHRHPAGLAEAGERQHRSQL
jgi:hypothetical protein